MPLIKMTVVGQNLKQYNSVVLAEDSSDLLKMQFNFRSSDWATVAPKTINFIGTDITLPVKIAETNSCSVPKEVIKAPGFGVSVFGGDMATNVVTIPVVNNEYNDDDPTIVSVTSCEVNADGDLIVILSDGREINAGHVVGADGATFVPHISDDYILTWTCTMNLPCPNPIDLKCCDEWNTLPEEGISSDYVWDFI